MNAPGVRLDETIGMKHGAGGRAMRALIEQVFAPGLPPMRVEGVGLSAMDDGAALCTTNPGNLGLSRRCSRYAATGVSCRTVDRRAVRSAVITFRPDVLR